MRKAERLDEFYDELKEIHKKYACDWRFGQLMCNILGDMQSVGIDPFFPEENEMIEFIRKYFNVDKSKNTEQENSEIKEKIEETLDDLFNEI